MLDIDTDTDDKIGIDDIISSHTLSDNYATNEHRLVLACLVQAIYSAINNDKSDLRWIASDKYYAYSYVYCCDMLDIDYINLRSHICQIRKTTTHKLKLHTSLHNLAQQT